VAKTERIIGNHQASLGLVDEQHLILLSATGRQQTDAKTCVSRLQP
jgi:hypothetical protein